MKMALYFYVYEYLCNNVYIYIKIVICKDQQWGGDIIQIKGKINNKINSSPWIERDH